jgi:hypothetical protein
MEPVPEHQAGTGAWYPSSSRRVKVFQDNDRTGLLVGLLVGAVAGMALGMLLAPKRGGETREMLRQRIASGTERVRRMRRGEENGE